MLRNTLALLSLMPVSMMALAQAPTVKIKEQPGEPPDAQIAQAMPAQESVPPRPTAEDISAFLDGMLPAAMAIGDIAGAVVVVVKDDRVLVSKGYGFADMEKRTPVSAERTMFRPGSISKLFAWTAVMQQVEAGRLNLDADINTYLDFKIEGFGRQPIKLRHLMTHTAGFEERIKDMALDDPRKLKPLEAVLKEVTPARIFPPGKIPAYSNYGAALAGYIVQRVSGMPFADYVEQKIFRPLGMSHSTFRQPAEARLKAHVSQGYLEASGEPVPFELSPDAPAGALSASGVDMAQFMLAHLNDGALPARGEVGRILQPQTVQRMHSVANRPAPFIDAMALGFYEQNRNGVRTIAHGGDLTAFHSDLILIPAARLGLYMSFNSLGRDHATYNLRTALFEEFMDRYFPRQVPPPAQPVTSPGEQTRAVLGTYELSRRAETNLFSLIYVPGQARATSPAPGILEVDGLDDLSDQPRQFQEAGPWLWREKAGEAQLSVVRTPAGAIEYLAPDGYGPVFVFQPVPGYRNKRWLVPAIGAAAVILSVTALSVLISAIRRRSRRAAALTPKPAASRRIRLLSVTASLACFVFLVLTGVLVMLSSGESLWIFTSDATPFLRLVQLCGLLSVVGALVAAFAAVSSWRASDERLRDSIGRTLTAAACLVCAYVVIAFHFLALRLQY